jgi:hypothetical protein
VDTAFLLVKAMQLVEQGRNSLDFIDDDPVAASPRDEPLEGGWITAQGQKPRRVEQIDCQSSRERTGEPGRWPEEEKPLGWGGDEVTVRYGAKPLCPSTTVW